VGQTQSVFILSDNRLFRESLARIFAKKSDIEVVGSRSLGSDALEELLNSGAEILLLDSAAFLRSEGSHLLQEKPAGRCFKILMVAMEEEEKLFLEVVRRGACGFVPKEASAMDVVAAVRSVAEGDAVCTPRLCKYLFNFVNRSVSVAKIRTSGSAQHLTRREQQLIPLIDQGLTNKEIAVQLNLAEKTVKNHVHRILRKVGVENRMLLSDVYRTRDPKQSLNAGLLS
jgi:DNA-binding NarL/FixJ family response regulator